MEKLGSLFETLSFGAGNLSHFALLQNWRVIEKLGCWWWEDWRLGEGEHSIVIDCQQQPLSWKEPKKMFADHQQLGRLASYLQISKYCSLSVPQMPSASSKCLTIIQFGHCQFCVFFTQKREWGKLTSQDKMSSGLTFLLLVACYALVHAPVLPANVPEIVIKVSNTRVLLLTSRNMMIMVAMHDHFYHYHLSSASTSASCWPDDQGGGARSDPLTRQNQLPISQPGGFEDEYLHGYVLHIFYWKYLGYQPYIHHQTNRYVLHTSMC